MLSGLLKKIRNLFKKGNSMEKEEVTQCDTVNNDLETVFRVVRTEFTPTYTMGKFYINNEYFCDTLEDTVREDGVKIYGETAIPAGIYSVIITFSPRFKRELPVLLDVPNFEGIRIHNGSYPKDSLGCILIGKRYKDGMLTNSKDTINNLMHFITIQETKQHKFSIEIINDKTNK